MVFNNKVDLGNPSSYKEAGERLINQLDLNNIQKTSYRNFIRNVIPRYMNVVAGKEFKLFIEEWYLDDSEIMSDEICRTSGKSQEISLRAVARLVVNEIKVDSAIKLPETTYIFPFLVTKFPRLSEKGSFIVNGVDRVLISHLEKANSVLKAKDTKKPLAPHLVTFETSANKKLTISQNKNDLYFTFQLGNDGKAIDAHRGILNYTNVPVNTLLNNLNISQELLRDIVGYNPIFHDKVDIYSSPKDYSQLVTLFDMTSSERYLLNKKLSFKERLTGKTLAENISLNGELFLSKGTIVNAEDAEELQESGITRVMIKTQAGPMPLVNNGFVSVSKLIDSIDDIPESMIVKNTEHDDEGRDISYAHISKPEFDSILSKGGEGKELKTKLSLETDKLLGLHLTTQDILALLNMYSLFSLDLKGIEIEDDIDSLRNKMLANASEIFESLLATRIYGKIGRNVVAGTTCIKNQIEKALENFRTQSVNDSSFSVNLDCPENETITRMITSGEIGKLFQKESNINPLDEINHRRRISLLKVEGRGGVPGESNDPKPRSVNPSHLGRICCIESPEGKTIGLVLFLASLARVNPFGTIEAPFFKVDKVKQKIDFSKAIYMTYDEESMYTRAMSTKIAERDFAAVYLYKQGIEVKRYDLEPLYVEVDGVIQLLNKRDLHREAENLFQNNTAGATSYELKVGRKDWFIDEDVSAIRGDGTPCQAKWDEIDYVVCRGEHILSAVTASIPFSENNDGTRLMMGAAMGKQNEPIIGKEIPLVRTTMSSKIGKETNGVITSPCDGIVASADATKIVIQPIEGDEITISMTRDRISSEKTLLAMKPCVKKDQIIARGQVIADTSATIHGIVSGGTNICVAYGHWEGYNYEDAITINHRLVKQDILTSYRLKEFHMEVRKNEQPLTAKNYQEIKGANEKAVKRLDDRGCVPPGTRVKPEEVIMAKIVPKTEDVNGVFKAVEEKYTADLEGVVVKSYSNPTKDGGVRYTVVVETKEKIDVGDKLAGRHGNKGIISRIEPEWAMPRLEDGTVVDILLTPQGIPSRMNIGQLNEAQIGLILKEMGLRVITDPNSNLNLPEMKSLLNMYTGDEEGKIQLYDGRTGEKYWMKTTIGYAYISKLKHLAAHKIHARARGSASQYSRYGQPTQGKASNGGQRLGEMEMWAVHAHGAQKVLAELQIYKSDDPNGREDFDALKALNSLEALSMQGNTPIPYKMSQALLTGLNVKVTHYDTEGDEIDINPDRHIERESIKDGDRLKKERKIDRSSFKSIEVEEEDYEEEDILSMTLASIGINIDEDLLVSYEEDINKVKSSSNASSLDINKLTEDDYYEAEKYADEDDEEDIDEDEEYDDRINPETGEYYDDEGEGDDEEDTDSFLDD